MAQHQIPNLQLLGSIHSAELRLVLHRSTPAQSPVCTRRPMKLLWKNVSWSCQCIAIWKLVPATTTRQIMPYMDLTQRQEICIFLGQMDKEACPTSNPTHWFQIRGGHDLCRDLCRIDRPQRTPSFPPETHEYDPQKHLTEGMSKCMRRGTRQILRISRCSRTT